MMQGTRPLQFEQGPGQVPHIGASRSVCLGFIPAAGLSKRDVSESWNGRPFLQLQPCESPAICRGRRK